MTTYFITYIFIILFFIIEKILRKGKEAKSYHRGTYDKGSTLFVASIFILSLAIISTTIFFNFELGKLTIPVLFEIGIFMMIIGLIIRIFATLTLGQYYTRTLLVTKEQKIIKHGVYKFIRHPGYFGVFLLWIGAALTTCNIFTIFLVIVIEFIGYSYRIKIEEEMLSDIFGKEYIQYKKETYTFIPFIY